MIVKQECETDAGFGKKPGERSIEERLSCGIVVMDKPCGPSSHEVTAWVRKILEVEKSGHSGTLDPNVSGVLPVGIGDATKAMGFLLKSQKEYAGVVRFHRKLDEAVVKKVFKKFTGEITQTPPVKSAVRRAPRKRKVYYLEALEFNDRDVLFKVGCEAGTYIRKLCADIGVATGTGANMLELRRTRAGAFAEKDAVTLQALSDARWLWKERGDGRELDKILLPLEKGIDVKRAWVKDSAVESLCSGAKLSAPGVVKLDEGIGSGDTLALVSLKDELIAFAKAEASSAEMVEKKHGIVASTLRVIMRKGTYPKGW